MKLDTLSHAELFDEISDLAKEQGVTSQDMWNELVQEVLDSHLEMGELDKDMDLQNLRTVLSAMWEEYKREASAELDGMIEDKNNPDSTEQQF